MGKRSFDLLRILSDARYRRRLLADMRNADPAGSAGDTPGKPLRRPKAPLYPEPPRARREPPATGGPGSRIRKKSGRS